MPDATCTCPFCGNEVKSDLVKRLKMTGVEMSAADFQIIQRIEELQSRIFSLEQHDYTQLARIGVVD